jgi:hypothetical protein
MKKFMLLGILSPSLAQAQFHLNLFGGFSNYTGDLQSKGYTMQQSRPAFGGSIQYDLTSHFSLLAGLNYGVIGASDSYSDKAYLRARNLSFESRIYEANFMGEYNLLDLNTNRFSPYVFAGIAVYHFNPYAYDTLGHKQYLRQLSTEGEGLAQYPNSKPYKLTQFAIPFGGGIKFRVTNNIVLSYEIGLRKLFTDHLDDVSSTYVDRTILLNAKGPVAVEMAYRGGQLKGGSPTYPASGTVRGNPAHKDWYYFSGIRVSFAINTGQSLHRSKNGIMDCPKKVY